jgi:hypothetical protein
MWGSTSDSNVMAPTGEKVRVRMREWEREKAKTLDDCDTPGSTGNLAANRSGRAGLKEGGGLDVGKLTTGRKETSRERKVTSRAQPWEEKERRCTVRLFGTNSLKEGAVWHVNPLLGYATEDTQPASKHLVTEYTLRNNRGSGFFPCRAEPNRTVRCYTTGRDDVTRHHARFQGNAVVNTVTTQQYSLWTRCKATWHYVTWRNSIDWLRFRSAVSGYISEAVSRFSSVLRSEFAE